MSRVQAHGILLIILLAVLNVVNVQGARIGASGPRVDLDGWLPLQMAGWRGEQYAPPDAWREQLPAARFLVRNYTKGGREVELLMIESLDPGSFHSPMFCLPGAGWTPKEAGKLVLPNGAVSKAEFVQDFAQLTVRYWYLADRKLTSSLWRHKWNMLENKLQGVAGPNFSFRVTVRRSAADTPEKVADTFAEEALKALNTKIVSR